MGDLNEASSAKKEITQRYVHFFRAREYSSQSPVDFITPDDSVRFTNSTIIPWKKYAYFEPIPKHGIFVDPPQPCLRLRVLEDQLTSDSMNEKEPKRLLGYFNMVGILCEQEAANSLPESILDLLINSYGIPQNKIGIFVSEENDFISPLEKMIKVVRGEEEERGYQWTYGQDYQLSGEGAKIKFLQRDGGFKSIGQIIRITSPYKTTFEFGFGIETFLSRARSEPDYSSWTVFHCLPEGYRSKILLDLISCFGAGCTINPNQMTRKHRKEIMRLARRIVLAEKLFNLPKEMVEKSINKFINIEFDYHAEDYVQDKLEHARRLVKEDEEHD